MIKELFKLDDEFLVEINKEWISTIPEFKKIITDDKGSKGDTQARKKLHATKVFTFIYHYCDFQSQFSDFEEDARRDESLYNAGLTEEDVNTTVEIAIDKYKKLQETRVLKLLAASNGAIDKLGQYFEDIDFSLMDASGKFVYDPKSIMASITNLDKVYGGLKDLESRVKKELKETARVRGDAILNEMENPDEMAKFMTNETNN